MAYYDGFAPVITFRLEISREDRTLASAAFSVRDTEDEIRRAKNGISRILREYPISASGNAAPGPVKQEQKAIPGGNAGETEESAPDGAAEEAPKPPEPVDGGEGIRGLVYLKCPNCGAPYQTFLKNKQKEVSCRCGYRHGLTGPLAKYQFSCPYCERTKWGHTNVEDATLSVKCMCGGLVDLEWNKNLKMYTN